MHVTLSSSQHTLTSVRGSFRSAIPNVSQRLWGENVDHVAESRFPQIGGSIVP
jgi:predicted lipase